MARNCPVPFHFTFKLSLLVCIILLLCYFTQGKPVGISANLIHRDSPKSPLYNPSISYFERLNKSFHRSISRAEYFKKRITHSSTGPFQSHVVSADGEYLMEVSIGTPIVDFLAIADTGSDLTWIQCQPCIKCFDQETPYFNPYKSISYRQVSCYSPLCYMNSINICNPGNKCGYRAKYADQSFSFGDLSLDTISFESENGEYVSFPDVGFGCGHENGGSFKRSAAGIVGLGGGGLSIIRQLSESVNGKFSYCLAPRDSAAPSKIFFGTNADVSGPGVVSTKLFNGNRDTFYRVNLEGFSVGSTTIPFKVFSKLADSSSPNDIHEGNIIVDSGTMLTFVPREIYKNLESEIIKLASGTRVPDPGTGVDIDLCYKNDQNLQIPQIVAHFTGADIILPPKFTFLEVFDDEVCFTIAPTDEVPIFGNLMQINYHIGYNLVEETLSFLQTDCTEINY